MKKNTKFLGLSEPFCDFDKSAFAVLPISYDRTASFLKGTANAPGRIIEVSEQLEFFDEQLCRDFYQCGIYTDKQIGSNDLQPEQLVDIVYKQSLELLNAGKKIIAIGGEHSVSIGVIKAYKDFYSDLSVLQIDAHADLRDDYEDSKYSHACVMKRVFDMDIPFVQVGIRSFDKPQYKFMLENKIPVYTPWKIRHTANWIEQAIANLSQNVYITIDIDGLDCSIAPGTGTPEPGGLAYHQVVDLITRTGQSKSIVGGDVVEVIPNIAGASTEITASRLLYKLIAAAQL